MKKFAAENWPLVLGQRSLDTMLKLTSDFFFFFFYQQIQGTLHRAWGPQQVGP